MLHFINKSVFYWARNSRLSPARVLPGAAHFWALGRANRRVMRREWRWSKGDQGQQGDPAGSAASGRGGALPSPWPPLTLSNLQHCAPNYSQNVSKGYERLTSPKPEQCHFQEVLTHWLTTKPIHFHFFFLSSTLSLEFLQSIQYWGRAGIRSVKVFSKQDNN